MSKVDDSKSKEQQHQTIDDVQTSDSLDGQTVGLERLRLANPSDDIVAGTANEGIELEEEEPLDSNRITPEYSYHDEQALNNLDSKYLCHDAQTDSDLNNANSRQAQPRQSVASPRTEFTATAHDASQFGPLNNGEDNPGGMLDMIGGPAPANYKEDLLIQNDPEISSELLEIYKNTQKCLDIRHKYMRLSLQRPNDDPRDDPSWKIYPPQFSPFWRDPDEPGARGERGGGKLDKEVPDGKARDPGQDVGSDFDYSTCEIPGKDEVVFKLDATSVYQVYENEDSLKHGTPIVQVPTIKDYYMDIDAIIGISSDGPTKSFAYKRLQYLQGRFNLYSLLHEYQELAETKKNPHRDFYNVRKVDTHIHHSASMNQKHLLRFIKHKLRHHPDELVIYRDNKLMTLREVFESLNLTAYDLSIDNLDMHAHADSFHRFDKFNLKYNPLGSSRLRTIFLKTDNYLHGRYLAELTREVMSDLESSKYQFVEYRISIYGRSMDEWDKLAAWVVDNKLFSPNVRWLIQIPRLYHIYKQTGLVVRFEEIIKNIFQPLFDVTHDPQSHPKLHVFLQRVIGFDSVDDESKFERRVYKKFPLPKFWDNKHNPPYSYWIYYLYANICSLNVWRKQRNFSLFVLRPHSGEAGDTDHLISTFITSHSISHGITLRKIPFVQYLYYLDQIGIAMSPLSNNALFLKYEKNPFIDYFQRGMNVSLSTDDPLQFAYTKEPLIEEYSVAAQIYKLSNADMCELAKNSVVQSGYESQVKAHWLGKNYTVPGIAGNSVVKTNIPNIRAAYRYETYEQELALINKYTKSDGETNDLTLSALEDHNYQDEQNSHGRRDSVMTIKREDGRASSSFDMSPMDVVPENNNGEIASHRTGRSSNPPPTSPSRFSSMLGFSDMPIGFPGAKQGAVNRRMSAVSSPASGNGQLQ